MGVQQFTASSGISPPFPPLGAWVGGLPPGISGSFSPATVVSGSSSTLTVNIAAGTPVGTYNLVVVASGAAGVVHQDTLQVIVQAGNASQDFSV